MGRLGTLVMVTVTMFLVLGCVAPPETKQPEEVEPKAVTEEGREVVEAPGVVKLQTEDGVTLVGTYLPGTTGKGVILLHMLGRDRASWGDFGDHLNYQGYHVLLLDLRGHGESTWRGREMLDWRQFSSEDFKKMVLDVEAAKTFLEDQGVEEIGIIGASIGANAALAYTTRNAIDWLVLLSPGLVYRGIEVENAAKQYTNPVLIVVARDDKYSADSSNRLIAMFRGEKKLKIVDGSYHGTDLLRSDDIKQLVTEWILQH